MPRSRLPLCGAKAKQTGRPRQNPAGKGTGHPGVGRCRYHGGCTPSKHGVYSTVARQRVRDLLAQVSTSGVETTDLTGEVAILRALSLDYIDRLDEFQDALLAWYRTHSEAINTLLRSNDASAIRNAIVQLRSNMQSRPPNLLELTTLSTVIDRIARVAERHYRLNNPSFAPIESFLDIQAEMVRVLMRYVTDQQVLQNIAQGWDNIEVDPRTFKLLARQPGTSVARGERP